MTIGVAFKFFGHSVYLFTTTYKSSFDKQMNQLEFFTHNGLQLSSIIYIRTSLNKAFSKKYFFKFERKKDILNSFCLFIIRLIAFHNIYENIAKKPCCLVRDIRKKERWEKKSELSRVWSWRQNPRCINGFL